MLRLDVYLVQNNFFETREKAQQAIRDGQVKVNGETCLKNNRKIADNETVELGQNILQYVSRGGLKLEKAVNEFRLHFQDATILDVGASTGGFTHVALHHGAQHVFAMDVGTNQLHESLRTDARVSVTENCHIRDYTLAHTRHTPCDYIVTDVSFISLTAVIPYFKPFLKPTGEVVALIKPQFELTEKAFFKNGIVRDFKRHINAIDQVVATAQQSGLSLRKLTHSPILDPRKNVEYLALFTQKEQTHCDIRTIVRQAEAQHHNAQKSKK